MYSIEAQKDGNVRFVKKDIFYCFVTKPEEATKTDNIEIAKAVCRFLMKPWCLYERQDTLTVKDDTGQPVFRINRIQEERSFPISAARDVCLCGCGRTMIRSETGRTRKFATNACRQRYYRRRQKGLIRLAQ